MMCIEAIPVNVEIVVMVFTDRGAGEEITMIHLFMMSVNEHELSQKETLI